jgi:hypothetical protein
LEHIIVPIAVFVVTTDDPPEKLSWSARRGGTALNNQTQVFRLLEICLGRSKRVV